MTGVKNPAQILLGKAASPPFWIWAGAEGVILIKLITYDLKTQYFPQNNNFDKGIFKIRKIPYQNTPNLQLTSVPVVRQNTLHIYVTRPIKPHNITYQHQSHTCLLKISHNS